MSKYCKKIKCLNLTFLKLFRKYEKKKAVECVTGSCIDRKVERGHWDMGKI